MRYAKLVKLGGTIIPAEEADYEDYKGFLRCPNDDCNQVVFLRKAHERGSSFVSASFVHHRAKDLETCELRVNSYTREEVDRINSQARDQRLSKLVISMWKYLKTNLAISLSDWSKLVRDVKSNKFLSEVVEYAEDVLDSNIEFISENTFNRVSKLLKEGNAMIVISPQMKVLINKFLASRERDWDLHCRISHEALDLFLRSPQLKEIRYRWCCCLSHPIVLEQFSDLLDLDTATQEWRGKFVSYLTLYAVFTFLMVDWFEIFEFKK